MTNFIYPEPYNHVIIRVLAKAVETTRLELQMQTTGISNMNHTDCMFFKSALLWISNSCMSLLYCFIAMSVFPWSKKTIFIMFLHIKVDRNKKRTDQILSYDHTGTELSATSVHFPSIKAENPADFFTSKDRTWTQAAVASWTCSCNQFIPLTCRWSQTAYPFTRGGKSGRTNRPVNKTNLFWQLTQQRDVRRWNTGLHVSL